MRGPRARSPSPEDEEEPPQQQEEEDQEEEEEEEEDGQEQEQEHDEEASSEEDDDQGGVAGDIPAVWMRGPARLPNRPIPLEQRPIIRPDGKR